MDVVSSGAEPRARLPRSVPVIVVALVLNGLVGADAIAQARARERVVDVVLTTAAATAPPARSRAVQDVVVELGVRNAGSYAVQLLDQQLDGGGPVDRVPGAALRADATSVLPVRWRVLCAEVGSLFGPRALDLTVRPRRGEQVSVSLSLPPTTRQVFRTAASRACAP